MVPDVPPSSIDEQRAAAIAKIVYALPELTDDFLRRLSRESTSWPRRDLVAVLLEQEARR